MEKIHCNPPLLVLVTGAAGSGKTTLSLRLLDRLQAMYIDKDMIADGFTEERSGEFYEQGIRKGMYAAIDNIARGNLLIGNSVLIDSTYSTEVQRKGWIQRYRTLTKKTNSRLKILRCITPEAVLKERFQKRNHLRDRHVLRDWRGFLKREPVHVPLPREGIEIDTSESLERAVTEALHFVQRP